MDEVKALQETIGAELDEKVEFVPLPPVARELAEQAALDVEWKGDDYGARKRYYVDLFLQGWAACQRHQGAGSATEVHLREQQ